MIKEAYVSFETAKSLKEKGFNEDIVRVVKEEGEIQYLGSYQPSLDYLYHTWYKCPTIQMAMRWLREVHHLHIIIQPYVELPDNGEKVDTNNFYHWDFYVMLPSGEYPKCKRYNDFQTYEEAVEAALKYCLENLIE